MCLQTPNNTYKWLISFQFSSLAHCISLEFFLGTCRRVQSIFPRLESHTFVNTQHDMTEKNESEIQRKRRCETKMNKKYKRAWVSRREAERIFLFIYLWRWFMFYWIYYLMWWAIFDNKTLLTLIIRMQASGKCCTRRSHISFPPILPSLTLCVIAEYFIHHRQQEQHRLNQQYFIV